MIIQERLQKLPTIRLDRGMHDGFDDGACANDGACAMELVSWLAAEPWSDHPACACPVIGSFVRPWNDSLPDGERTCLLLPLIPRIVDTKGSATLARRRAMMAADWLIRTQTPAWLRLAGFLPQADALSNLPEIISTAQLPSILPLVEAAQRDADALLQTAMDDATLADWREPRQAAAQCGANAAVKCAMTATVLYAALYAPLYAALAAMKCAALDAAEKKLAPVTIELQQSAVSLVIRMIESEDA